MREALKEHFGQPDKVNSLLKDSQRGVNEKEEGLSALEREMKKIQEEMTRTHRLFLDGHLTPQGFGDLYKPAEERLNQLRSEHARLEGALAHLRVQQVSTDQVVSDARGMYERWPTMTGPEKRLIAETMVERITIGKGEIDIKYAYGAISKDLCNTQRGLKAG